MLLPGHRHHRPQGAPCAHRRRLHLRRTSPSRPAICKAQGAMAALLKDALKPNLVQTLEDTPAFVHGGPFANIAHGCNSPHGHAHGPEAGRLLRDGGRLRRGSGRGEVPRHQVPHGGPRARRRGGGGHGARAQEPRRRGEGRPERREPGGAGRRVCRTCCSTWRTSHRCTSLPCVVAINRFPTDTEAELALVERKCRELGVNVALSEVWAKGGEGGQALAEEVVRLCEEGDAKPLSQTFQLRLWRRSFAGAEDRGHRHARLPRRRRGLRSRRPQPS